MHIVLLKDLFSTIHLSSFLCYADQQRSMLMVKSMKKMLRQTFSVFEPEQCLEMRNYKYRIEDFIVFWQMELVCFIFVFCFVLVHLFVLSFGCVTIDREMKKCQCYLIYDKVNGYVARLEWVRDSKKNSKEMYSFPCSLLTQFLFPHREHIEHAIQST